MNRGVTHFRHPELARCWFAGVALLCLLAACGKSSSGPEEQVRAWVHDAQVAAETKARRDLVSLISPAYADARGYDRDAIEKRLRVYFMRQNSIHLVTSVDELTLYGDTAAEVELTVGMAGTNEGAFGFSADAYRFSMELEKGDSGWQLISARWGALGSELQ
jgi:hypothetical protein